MSDMGTDVYLGNVEPFLLVELTMWFTWKISSSLRAKTDHAFVSTPSVLKEKN
jgi:hypothetical protein